MRKTLLYVLCSIAMMGTALPAAAQTKLEGVYQIPNSDFEKWTTVNNKVEPDGGWHSFASAEGSMVSFGRDSSPHPSAIDHNGGKAAKIYSKSIIGKKANGNLTTGIVNMGSTTPSDAANHNKTKRSDPGHSLKFAGMPDAAECYATFKSGGSKNGRVQFIIHGDVDYRDPELDDQKNYKVGSAAILITECTAWTKFTADFVYTGTDKTPSVHYMLASATTNPVAGGSKGDELCLDDVKLIYYHSLASCKYDGVDVNFEDNKASVNVLYDEDKLSLEKKGVGATVEKSYDKTTGVLTINVKGNDYEADNSSITTYSIQFEKPAVPTIVSEKTYTEPLYVSVNGITTGPQNVTVLVQTRDDGKFNFVLKNFVLVSEENRMPIGNIAVQNLDRNGDDFTFQGVINILPGDIEDVDEDYWLGPKLGEVPLDMKGTFVGDDHIKVAIDIDMITLEQVINVHLGYTPAVANLTLNEGVQYTTFYAPFEVNLDGKAKAYTCESVKGNVLVLTELADAVPANTAVILENTADGMAEFSQDYYNFDENLTLEDGTTGLLRGLLQETQAPVGSFVLQNPSEQGLAFYRVEEGDDVAQPMVAANRCYLTLPEGEGSDVKVIVFTGGEGTGIDAVRGLLNGHTGIYDLQGRRLSALQKGLNIVNGKTILVK